LAKVQQGLAEAQARAEKIRADGKARAEAIRIDSEKRTVEEMARLKQESSGELDAEASRVSEQLRRQAAQLAIEQALAALPGKLDARPRPG
jgi:F-type H+-transporting ATPase subunit b